MSDLRMPDINKLMIAGRLTRNPELRYIPSGTALCKLSVAHSKKFKTKSGEEREDKVFLNVTVWGKTAEWVADKLRKGDPVLVEGRLTMNEWEDKNTGQKRSSIEVNAERVQQMAWPPKEESTTQGSSSEEEIPEDECPF